MKSTDWLSAIDARLADQFRFILEIDRLKGVLRASPAEGGARRENTAEHSWHVSACASVLAEHAIGDVSIDRVVRMLLVHDIVEIDAGDTPLYEQDAAASHVADERRAAARLFGLLPDDQGRAFHTLWEEFEAANTADARFARAVDRLLPMLINHAAGGGTWTDYDVDEGMVRERTGRIEEGSAVLWKAAEAVFADAVAKGWLKAAPSART